MNQNLVIAVLGNQNAGKSYTWNTMFRDKVRTGRNERKLPLSDSEYVNVFLVSGSPEERQKYVGDIITVEKPRIVLCSMQYHEMVARTIDFFLDNDYFFFVHWLNPGYSDPTEAGDDLGIFQHLIDHGALVGVRDGKTDPASRIQEMRAFIRGWAKERNLLLTRSHAELLSA